MTSHYVAIEKAARDQGWQVDRTEGGHRKLIPPDPSQPIVFTAMTSGDKRAWRNFLAQARRSGLVWPWPPISRRKKNGDEKMGRTRKITNPADITAAREMIQEGFPADQVAQTLGVARSTLHRYIAEAETTTVDSEWKAIQDQAHEDQDHEEKDKEQQEMSTQVSAPIRYEQIRRPGIVAGYEVSDLGEVFSPLGAPLKPTEASGILWVSLRRLGAQRPSSYVKVRLDVLVCEAFHGPRPGPEFGLRHLDGDDANCRADNLRWEQQERAPKVTSRKKSGSYTFTPEDYAKSIATRRARAQRRRQQEESVIMAENSAAEEQVGAAQGVTPWPSTAEEDVRVETTTTYSCRGLRLTVHPDGTRKMVPNTDEFTAEQWSALAKIMARIER